MCRFATYVFVACFASLPVNAAEAPIDLMEGRSLAAWEFVTPAGVATDLAAVCQFQADGSLAVVGQPTGYLATKKSYADYTLHVEWRWPAAPAKNSNSGVLLHIASPPKDRAWPVCFQVQTKPGRAGDVLPMAGAAFAEKLSSPPEKTSQLDRQADSSEKPAGEWNVADIVCRDGTIHVVVNGVRQNTVTQANPGSGKIGFQLEGTPFELRNVRLLVE